MMTFHENPGYPCDKDDHGHNQIVSWETPEFIATVYLGYPWVSRVNKEAWNRTNIEQ